MGERDSRKNPREPSCPRDPSRRIRGLLPLAVGPLAPVKRRAAEKPFVQAEVAEAPEKGTAGGGLLKETRLTPGVPCLRTPIKSKSRDSGIGCDPNLSLFEPDLSVVDERETQATSPVESEESKLQRESGDVGEGIDAVGDAIQASLRKIEALCGSPESDLGASPIVRGANRAPIDSLAAVETKAKWGNIVTIDPPLFRELLRIREDIEREKRDCLKKVPEDPKEALKGKPTEEALSSKNMNTSSRLNGCAPGVNESMALSPKAKMKYKSPPVFYGKEGEDPVAWVERYEKVARYNRWTDEDLKDNFEMFLDGAARKW